MFGKILSLTVNICAYEFRVYSFLYVIKYIIVNDYLCHLCGVILTLKSNGCDSNQGDINSHDSDMVAYESKDTSTPSIDISFHKDVDSQSNEIAEDSIVNPTLDDEVIPLRRSARERKQTQFFGNPWLYRITYRLKYVDIFFSWKEEICALLI